MKTICCLVLGSLSSCASIFYGPDGKPTAKIYGDYEYRRAADGSVAISLRNSESIRARGNAWSKGIAAGGALAVPLATGL